MKNILVYLDTDETVSSFDILIAYDAGYDNVIPYSSVTPELAKKLIQDSMFPRGPAGVKHTVLFIGGSDPQKVESLRNVATETMFEPFRMSSITDPRGAYTTAAAIVAKIGQVLRERLLGGFEKKQATVLAATGPVGRTAALLLALEKTKVVVTSRKKEKAEELAEQIAEKTGSETVAEKAENEEEILKACQGSEIVVCAGKAGTRLLGLETQKKLKASVLADANAVPPLGIEGLSPDADGKHMWQETYGIGALAAGALKLEIEKTLLREALQTTTDFDYRAAYELGKKLTKLP